jgi:hypothetical protein
LGRCQLSSKELSRAEVMGRVKAGSLRLREAGELLELSYRQAKRIWARYRGGGAKALQHANCGRRSNRAYGREFRGTVLERVKSRYADFGPTLAAEHLASEDELGTGGACRDTAALDAGGGTVAESTETPTLPAAAGAESSFWRTGAVGRQLS